MTLRLAALLCLLSATGSVALTRYCWPSIQTVQTTKEVVRTDIQTVVRTVTRPDGTSDTTTTIVDHSIRTDTSKNIIVAIPFINVSGLVGNDLSKRGVLPIYGVSINKEIIGPITIGAFGLTSGVIGLSVGLNF